MTIRLGNGGLSTLRSIAPLGDGTRGSVLRRIREPRRPGTVTRVRKAMDNRSIGQGMMVRVGLGVFGLMTLAALVLTLVSDRGLLEVRTKAARLLEIDQQIQELEAENSSLIEEIRSLRSDPLEIERRAREDLKLIRPGEVTLMAPSETPSTRVVP